MTRRLLVLVALAGCSDSERSTESVRIGDLHYAVPSDWRAEPSGSRGEQRVTWAPSANPRAETLTVIRTRPLAGIARAGIDAIEPRLIEAQRTLPRASFGPARRFTSKHGILGVRMDGTFVPPGASRSYRRVHLAVVDGTSVVHVLYTAQNADDEVPQIVVDSLRREEG